MKRWDIINKIISEFKLNKYLEIGVRDPKDCFDKINANIKHSVDPGVECSFNDAKYKYTSDDFFSRLQNNELDLNPDYKWDVVFIDGLHLAPQVERDVLNSLNHLSPNGFIVLHDAYPFLYEYNHTRLIEDYWGQPWNGTVWKSIYKFRTIRDDLKICTIKTDEGVSLIKRGNSKLIPFENRYFEYSYLYKNPETSLGLIEIEELNNWLYE